MARTRRDESFARSAPLASSPGPLQPTPVDSKLATLALALTSCSLTACIGLGPITGDNIETSEVRSVPTFTQVSTDQGVDVYLSIDAGAGASIELELSAESNLIELIETEVEGSELRVDADPDIRANLPMRVSASVADIARARANNAGRVILDGVARESLELDANNGASLTAKGSAEALTLTANNGSNIDTAELSASSARVDVNNGASASVCVSGLITGEVNNGASLRVSCGGDTSGVEVKNGGSID